MRTRVTLTLLSLLSLTPLIAWRAAGEPWTLGPQSRLWIDGKSTVRKFSCKAPAFTIDADAAPGALGAVMAGQKPVRALTVTVPAAKMDCGNGTMNEHMWKALKSKDAPTIAFTLADYDVAKSAGSVQGTLRGTLSVGGAQRPVTLVAQATDAGDGAVRVSGAYELHMKEFDLKPPTLMMGTLKVDELVIVNFDLVLQRTAVATLDR